MENQSPLPNKGRSPPIFGPCLLWPNGWMYQDATWYGGRPRTTRHCVGCGPSSPQKKGTPTPTQFLAHVYCGQMAGWMKRPLGRPRLRPHCTRPGPSSRERGTAPLFSAHVYCGHGRPSQLLLSSCYKQQTRTLTFARCGHIVITLMKMEITGMASNIIKNHICWCGHFKDIGSQTKRPFLWASLYTVQYTVT